jgi:hypothetical protein
MVYGFPGITKQYLPAEGLNMVMTTTNPNRIAIRDIKLRNWGEAMERNDTIRLQYASKYKTIANYYKKWKGELEGLKRNRTLEQKQAMEEKMKQWIASDSARSKEYGSMLASLAENYAQLKSLNHANDYMTEAGQGIEIIAIASKYRKLVELSSADQPDLKAIYDEAGSLVNAIPATYKNYNRTLDERTGAELLRLYSKKVLPSRRPWVFDYMNENYEDDYEGFMKALYKKSIFLDTARLRKTLENYKPKSAKIFINDPVYDVMKSFYDYQELQLTPESTALAQRLPSFNDNI